MKINYKQIIILLLTFLVSLTVAYFIRNSSVFKKPKASKTLIEFTSDTHDFGELKHKIEKGRYFVYKNTGSNDLKIRNIVSNCGCTIPKWSRNSLKPNGIDSIFVQYDSQLLGYFTKTIYVYSNSETSPDPLYIKGQVKQ